MRPLGNDPRPTLRGRREADAGFRRVDGEFVVSTKWRNAPLLWALHSEPRHALRVPGEGNPAVP